jgi:hypothetical protein
MQRPASRAEIALDLAYDAVLRRVLSVLGSASIPVMPLKGVLFAYLLYENPADRLRGDIDLLVREEDFSRAISALSIDGFEAKFTNSNGRECTLTVTNPPIEVDLHRALFALGRYSLPTAGLFARGQADEALYSDRVILPDPYDAFAHVVGHAAADHLEALPNRTQQDLSRLVARFQLNPRTCAAHLDSHGLGRATRYVLGLMNGVDDNMKELISCLRPDPVGIILVRIARMLTSRFARKSILSRLAGFLVNSSIPRSAVAVSIALLNRARMPLGLEPL